MVKMFRLKKPSYSCNHTVRWYCIIFYA